MSIKYDLINAKKREGDWQPQAHKAHKLASELEQYSPWDLNLRIKMCLAATGLFRDFIFSKAQEDWV